MKPVFLFAIVMSMLSLVACAPATSATATKPAGGSAPAASTSSGGAAQQLSVNALDTLRFEPATLTAKAGQPINVTVDNTGQSLHDFSMTEGASQPVKILAQPGQKGTGTFTIDKPGTYTFFCSQPGHEAAGMKGTITIQ